MHGDLDNIDVRPPPKGGGLLTRLKRDIRMEI